MSGNKTAVSIWEASTGKRLLDIPGRCNSVSFSPNGDLLAAARTHHHDVRLFDLPTGKALDGELVHPLSVNVVVFSQTKSSGGSIATGCIDGEVRLWDAYKRKMVWESKIIYGGSVNSVAFSPNGTCIVSGSEDRTVRLWDSSSGNQLKKMGGHFGPVSCVAFSSNGQWIVSGGGITVRLWEVSTGKKVITLEGHVDSVLCVATSPNGEWVARVD